MYIGDNIRVQVDFLGIVRLQLSTVKFLELHDVAHIPLIKKNLISIPILDRLGYSFHFGTGKVKLYLYSLSIGNGILCGSLYILELFVLPSAFATLIVNTISHTKCLRLNEKSSIL